MGPSDRQGGVSDTIQDKSSSFPEPYSVSSLSSGIGKSRSSHQFSGGHASKRGNRISSDLLPWLLQSTIRSPKSFGIMETSHRLVHPEPIHPLPIIQDGDTSVCNKLPSERSMANITGFTGCILPHSDKPQEQTLSQVLPRYKGISISSPSFWSLHKPKSLHQGTEAGTGIRSRTWSSAPHVSGRLAPQPQLLSKISLPDTLADTSMLSLGLDSECGKISVDPYPDSSLLGNPDRLPYGESLASREKDFQMVGSGSRVFGPPSPSSKPLVASVRALSFLGKTNSVRSYKNQASAVATQTPLETGIRSICCPGSSGSKIQPVPSLVDNTRQFAPRNLSRCSEDQPLPIHRQLQHGLGCPCCQSNRLRPMVGGTETVAHQCTGTACCLARSTSFCITSEPLKCGHNVRQHGCNCICKESGWHTLRDYVHSDIPNLPVGRTSQDKYGGQTCARSFECSSRQSVEKEPNTEIRMVNESDNSRPGIQALGKSPCRSVCPQTKHKAASLYVSHSRQDSLEGRLPDPKLEESICLRISSNKSNQALPKQSDVRSARIDSHSPLVAKPRMVSGSTRSVSRLPLATANIKKSSKTNILPSVSYSPRNPKSSRMEIISGFTQEKGFSKEVSQRISVPTRKSTSGVYENKWVAFQTWCNDHTVDPAACSIPDIADFLLYLFEKKKLSVSTIKGYRSCLSQVMSARGIDISSNRELNSLVKSFSLERPISIRETPRWDLMIVLRHLMRLPYEPLNLSSLAKLYPPYEVRTGDTMV